MEFKKFLLHILRHKDIALPGRSSQFKLSPPFRRQLLKKQKDKIKNARHAGVVALFYPDHDLQTKLVLILRKTYKGVHSAQIGFPGGKYEEHDEDIKYTALRETYEEIGVPVDNINIYKALTQVYIPPSNFYVQPFFGVTQATPNFIKQDEEVEEIVEVLLEDFLNDNNIIEASVSTSYSKTIEVPAFELNGHIIWGATAMMLSEIKDMLKQML